MAGSVEALDWLQLVAVVRHIHGIYTPSWQVHASNSELQADSLLFGCVIKCSC
jgi:hypothetical protein